jgi:hypothetical protein
MKWVRATFILALILSGAIASAAALAHGPRHGGHVRFGVVIGAPAYWYYPPPYYYYPPVAVVPSPPPVYVERTDLQSPERASSYWYYCPDTNSYYPYVKECPSPWQRIEPRAPNS